MASQYTRCEACRVGKNEMKNPEIKRKIDTLREYLNDIKAYTLIETSALLANKEKMLAMERLFQLMVDEAIEVNAYISYQVMKKTPESVKEISESAKVRNQIIHDYEKLQKIDTIEAIKKFFPLYEIYIKILIEKLPIIYLLRLYKLPNKWKN